MKNKLLCVILAIAVFIPTVVAVVSYKTSDKTTVVSGDLASVVRVADLDGKEFTFEKDKGGADREMIERLQAMIDGGEAITALPDVLAAENFYKVTFCVDKLETPYSFYFSTDETDTFFTKEDGSAFSVTSDKVADFLLTECAQSIYSSSRPPVLTLSAEYKVAPVTSGEGTSSWMYKNSSGAFVATALTAGDADPSYDVDGGLSLDFDNAPDNFTVKVTDSEGKELFNDLYQNIGSLSLTPGATVNVAVSAKWYEDESRDYFGNLNYAFRAKVSAPAEFYPGVTSLQQGGVVSITALNVKDASKIGFTCEPDIGFTPTWHSEGEYTRTLIAFGADLTVGTYTLTFTYAGTTQNVALELQNAGFSTRNYTVEDEVFKKAYSDEALAAFKDESAKIAAESDDSRLWNGAWLATPLDPEAPISAGYGHMFNLTQAAVSYRHNGVDYKAQAGTAVVAANAGKVVYAGETDYSGKMVVIDHGWGLKTWYAHLGDVSVAVGDSVKKGDKLGECGSTGFFHQEGVHVSMTLFDRDILPYSTWDDNYDYTNAGLEMGIPMYEKK